MTATLDDHRGRHRPPHRCVRRRLAVGGPQWASATAPPRAPRRARDLELPLALGLSPCGGRIAAAARPSSRHHSAQEGHPPAVECLYGWRRGGGGARAGLSALYEGERALPVAVAVQGGGVHHLHQLAATVDRPAHSQALASELSAERAHARRPRSSGHSPSANDASHG